MVCLHHQSRRFLLTLSTDRSALRNVVPNSICYENDLVRMGATQHKQEAFVSRPTSGRTIGSTSGWPSDVESREASQTPSEMRSSLSHSKRPVQLQYLLICEAPKIEDFLAKALRTMQQLAVKRIAKAWIKGICPKKQAMFPYNKKKREREGSCDDSVSQPGWWPEKSLCKFIEPDHIRRDGESARLHLMFGRTDWNRTNQPVSSPPTSQTDPSTIERVEQRLC